MVTMECARCGGGIKGSVSEALAWDAKHACADAPAAPAAKPVEEIPPAPGATSHFGFSPDGSSPRGSGAWREWEVQA